MIKINRILRAVIFLGLNVTFLFLIIACEKGKQNGEDSNETNQTNEVINFSNGIPANWTVSGCEVNNSEKYGNNASVEFSNNSSIACLKTGSESINMVEFFLKGSGILHFYLDGELITEFGGNDNWERCRVYLPAGEHEIKWATGTTKSDGYSYMANVCIGEGVAPGQYRDGGIVGFVKHDLSGYLVISTELIPQGGFPWNPLSGSEGKNTSATETAYGAGKRNTQKICEAYGAGNYAANLVKGIKGSGTGTYDWFLPCRDELDSIKRNIGKNKNIIQGIEGGWYWTSSDLGYIEPQPPLTQYGSWKADKVCLSPEGLMCGNHPSFSYQSAAHYVLAVHVVGKY